MHILSFATFAFLLTIIHPVYALDSYADIVDEVLPSVVNISTAQDPVEGSEVNDNLMISPDLAGRESLGTGFFIKDDGYILTNYHIIKKAKTISAVTYDEKIYQLKLVGVDKPSDLAVLKINKPTKNKFKPVIFGNVDTSRIGDIILTVGNPYGLGISVSQGIISAKSRRIGLGEQQYIQTDAAINEGNSGGPMFNLDGEVIGINTAIFTEDGASGVGFALPANIANWVSSQLIKTGRVKRSWFGFKVAPGTDQYSDKSGFVITEIDERSNAYKDGMRTGDVILQYNDKAALDIGEFQLFMETMEIGQALRLKASSAGEEFKYVVRAQEMPAEALQHIANKALLERNKLINQDIEKGIFYISELGVTVKEHSPRGLLITKLDKRSPLLVKGAQVGDIILEANREDLYTADNLLDSIHNVLFEDIATVSLLIQGIDNAFYVTIEMSQEND